MAVWKPNEAVVDVQPGGPGHPWKIFGIQGQTVQHSMSGPSGGGTNIADRFGRNVHSGLIERVARVPDSNPAPITFDLRKRLSIQDWQEVLKRFNCEHSVRVRQGCGNFTDRTEFNVALLYDNVFATQYALDQNVADATTQQAQDLMRQISESAGDELMLRNVSHLDVSNSVSTVALNKVISIGYFRCAGPCGVGRDGNETFVAVGDAVTDEAPVWFITDDEAGSWAYSGQVDIAAATTSALDVVVLGPYVVVAVNGVGGGIAYALLQDLYDGVATPWTFASGVDNTNGSPRALAVADAQTIWAAGDGGHIHRSDDGGLSFEEFSSGGATPNQLNSAAFADTELGYFGGNTQTLVKYEKGVLSVLTLPGGVTGNITRVRIPNPLRRGHEVYFSTSTGQIWRSRTKGAPGSWEQLSFPGANSGSVPDFDFDPTSQVMWIAQTDAAADSRILRDLSGGAGGADVQVIGAFNSPANNGFNSIAPANLNDAVVVGELTAGADGFLGKIS